METTLTFLRPTDPTTHNITKTYRKQPDGIIEKLNDYNAGFLFEHVEVTLPKDGTLKALADVLRKYQPTHFRIQGRKLADVVPPCRRLSDYFPSDPGGYELHMQDVDGWPVSTDLLKLTQWDFSPERTSDLVRKMLINAKMDWLANVDFVVLFSASQFNTTELRVHIYWLFERPVTLREMRNVAKTANIGQPVKLMDYQVYKSVQPDFISAPICDNFKDPIAQRVFFCPSPYGIERVDMSVWEGFKKMVENRSGNRIDTASKGPKLGKNWVETLENHVGTPDDGINEPCYRAAAQLVQEVGQTAINTDMEKYVQLLHDTAWDIIDRRGDRGSNEDRKRYDLAKFRSYIRSAADKNFGDEGDQLALRVKNAIDEAKTSSDFNQLFSAYITSAASKLKFKYPGQYATIKAHFKTQLKRLVSISDWERAVRSMNVEPTTDYMDMLPGQNHVGGKDDKRSAENRLMMRVMQEYTLIKSEAGENFLGIDNNGELFLHDMTNSLAETLYADATIITNGGVSKDFGEKCMKYIRGVASSSKKTEFIKRIDNAMVGDRIYQNGQDISDPCWINLADSVDKPQCVKIEKTGITFYDRKSGPVLWRGECAPMPVLSTEAMNNDYGGVSKLIASFVNDMGHFITSREKDKMYCIAWAIAAITRRPMPYLLELTGSHNTGKSTVATLLKDLVDPDDKALELNSSTERFSSFDKDFYNRVYNQNVTIVDNISSLKSEVQDAFCQIITGMSYTERILYSHKQRNLYIKRPMIITSIDDVVTREDLKSRCLSVKLNTLQQSDPGFYDSWRARVPAYRRALLEILYRVMADYDNLKTQSGIWRAVSPRDRLLGLTMRAVDPGKKKKSLAEISAETAQYRALDVVLNDEPTRLLMLFIQHEVTDGEELNATDILIRLNKWIKNNYEMTLPMLIGRDADNILETTQCVVKPNPHLDSPRKLGRVLGRGLETLNLFSGWHIGSQNTVNRKRLFRKNITLTSIL